MPIASSNPSSIVSAGAWATTTNVYASDNVYATNTGATQNTEYPMDIGGFNFAAIPALSTINTVTVTVEAKASNNSRAQIRAELYDSTTLLSGALVLTNVTTADQNFTFTPTATLAQIKSANLKVRVINKRTASQTCTTSVDYVKIDVDYTAPVPSVTQAAYRFYDDGTESGSTALAAQDAGYTADFSSGDVNLQVRVLVQSTTAVDVPATDDFQLQWERNASDTWDSFTGSVAVPFDSVNLTDGAATTSRLTGGTGSFQAGKVSEDGLADDVGWTGNNYTELLYSITLKKSDLLDNDVLRFRVLRNGSTSDFTYSQYPTVTATGVGGAFTADVSDTMASTDSLEEELDRNITDTVGITELLAELIDRNITDTVGITEFLTELFNKSLADSVDTTELLAESISRFLVDTVDLPESIGTLIIPTYTGRPKYWDGNTHIQKPGKWWSGTAWIEKPWKTWTGSDWKTAK